MNTIDPACSALIVEDNEEIAYLLEHMLKREGYAVNCVADGLKAVDYISNNSPTDIVLLDIMLPYLDGFELIALIRAHPVWRETPVIVISGRSQANDVVRALDCGADDYVRKPYQPSELMARINCRVAAVNDNGFSPDLKAGKR